MVRTKRYTENIRIPLSYEMYRDLMAYASMHDLSMARVVRGLIVNMVEENRDKIDKRLKEVSMRIELL